MAEVKKTKKSTASKKNVAKKDEAPVIKKIIPETIDDLKIEDKYEGESDNKAIIFIAVAILIVVGTIVGLIVGCEKKEETPEKPNDEVVVPEDIRAIAEERFTARKNKDWAKSDLLRAQLAEYGYEIKDSKDGYTLIKK